MEDAGYDKYHNAAFHTERVIEHRASVFSDNRPFHNLHVFSTLFELCMPPQNAQFLTSVPQASESIEHASLSYVGNFTQNVMFILCCEFRLLYFRRETQTQLLFMLQF
jgi:hypothetical protein